jgi:PHD/YefM family antitoxin component YafN of YafNO toxin-antitoxin module
MEFHPQFIEKEGKKAFVILSIEEYQALTELIDDYEDLKDLREAKAESIGEQAIPLQQVLSQFSL